MNSYRCYLGDVQNLAIEKPDSFAVTDTKGRRWFCHPAVMDDNMDDIWTMMESQNSAYNQGFAESGTTSIELTCSIEELPFKLGKGVS